MSLIKVVWYVVRVKNMHPGSPSDPSGTTAAEAKRRYVYSILKPHGQSSGSPVRIYYSSISSRPQCQSQAVVCVSTPRKYPLRGYILGVPTHTTALDWLWGGDWTLTMWFQNWVSAPRLRLGRSSLTWHLELWPCGFKIDYTYLGFASAAAVQLGCEGDPKCIFFTLITYQATFFSYILW